CGRESTRYRQTCRGSSARGISRTAAARHTARCRLRSRIHLSRAALSWLGLPHIVDDVNRHRVVVGRYYHEYFCDDAFAAEIENICRYLPAFFPNLIQRNVSESLTRTHRSAHGPLAGRCPVVAHVTLHHLLEL